MGFIISFLKELMKTVIVLFPQVLPMRRCLTRRCGLSVSEESKGGVEFSMVHLETT